VSNIATQRLDSRIREGLTPYVSRAKHRLINQAKLTIDQKSSLTIAFTPKSARHSCPNTKQTKNDEAFCTYSRSKWLTDFGT